MARRFVPRAQPSGSLVERECDGKTGYPTEPAAWAGLKFLRHEGIVRTNDGMAPYQCRFCREWHFGH